MLKWCPKPFSTENLVQRDRPQPGREFRSGLGDVRSADTAAPGGGPVFEKDSRLTGGSSLWDLMNLREREDLLESARSDLRAEFQARENDLLQRHAAELDAVRTDFETKFETWTREMAAGSARDRQERAVEAAGLALALARKIIRDTAAVDHAMVVRTLETALYKARGADPLVAVMHPEDAEYLRGNPELMERLQIAKVVPDRRIERGGCLVRGGSAEWDATIAGQMETLAAIVEDTLAAGEAALISRTGESDDPGLE